jgi:low temperature requirement protein LtrA
MRLPGWFAERLEPVSPEAELRVSTVELFFDLVFVFTITQLTTLVAGGDVVETVVIFGVLWWMYAGYAWLTNTVPPARPARRILLLGGMAGFLIMALAIPSAFADGPWGGVAFAIGYLVIVVVHGGLYSQATAAIGRVVPFNLAATALMFGAAFTAQPWRQVLWAAALLLVWASPYFIGQKGFPLHPAHIVERHGLLVIIVLGESIVAIGIGANAYELSVPVIAAGLLGLALAAAMWWVYFGGGDEEAAEHALLHADVVTRVKLILRAYFYAHVPILLGIVATAAGIKKAIGHDHLDVGPAAALAAGVALFLAGDVWFRRSLGLAGAPLRLLAGLLALASVPIGQWSAIGQLGALVVLLIVMLALERPVTARSAG